MPDQIALLCKPIGRKGALVDDKVLTRDLARLNQKMAKRMKRTFQRTVATWDEPPEFHQMTEVSPEPAILIYSEDLIYGFVSGGTRVRYANMSPDFDPKTRPGELDARPGQGHMLFVSRKTPHPGIEARNFPKLVEDLHRPEFESEVDQLISQAVQRGAR